MVSLRTGAPSTKFFVAGQPCRLNASYRLRLWLCGHLYTAAMASGVLQLVSMLNIWCAIWVVSMLTI